MRVLILGGTEFVGKAFVEDAADRGWHVTTLNRQSHRPHDCVESLRGNRWEAGGLDEIGDGQWDLVVDTWSWAPVAVRDAARTLVAHADQYLYVSSRSVYQSPTAAGADERAPLVDSSPDLTSAEYPEAKAGGELAAVAAFGERALLLRAGVIIGPHENSGRLTWWLRRMERGGDVLAPGPKHAPVQYVDARDLAAFGLDAAASGLGGALSSHLRASAPWAICWRHVRQPPARAHGCTGSTPSGYSPLKSSHGQDYRSGFLPANSTTRCMAVTRRRRSRPGCAFAR
ncbi:MAG: NAD-dependent epimerase/dehydratase family protein [Microbacteriaceae bacterium]